MNCGTVVNSGLEPGITLKEVIFLNYQEVVTKMSTETRYQFRYEMVRFAQKNGIKPTAREYHTQPKIVRKWVKNYEKLGLSGLKDASRKPHKSPNKCSEKLEKKIIKVRIQTGHKFGARRLIERFDLKCGKTCINRIIREHKLKKKRKTKAQQRNELWSIKKLTRLFERIQVDVKVLTDIPLYWSHHFKHKLPTYEFTARDVKTGAAFVCYAHKHTSLNAATFIAYLLGHLKEIGFDLSKTTIQVDNGAEFVACGLKKSGDTPFEFIVKKFGASMGRIPPASPTFNSDVETFHRLVEDEFYDIEPAESTQELCNKMMTFLIDFNYLRRNSYKDNKCPIELAFEDVPQLDKSLFALKPILLDDHLNLYTDHTPELLPLVTQKSGKPDPFSDPAHLDWLVAWGALSREVADSFLIKAKMAQSKSNYPGGYYVQGLHIHKPKKMKFFSGYFR